MIANQVFEDEVHQKAGERYRREKQKEGNYARWGSNPGSIRIGEERVKMRIPRLYDKQTGTTEGLDSYKKLRETEFPSEALLKKIIIGLTEHRYEEVVKMATESFGLSQSSVSRAFIEESKKALECFERRGLGLYDFIALVMMGSIWLKSRLSSLLA